MGLLAGFFGLPPLPFELKTEEAAKQPPKSQALAPSKGDSGEQAATPSIAEKPVLRPADGSETKLDIARVSRDGPSVFAGRSKPNAYVTLLDGDKPLGSVKADSFGEWSFVTEHKFASLDPKITFQTADTPPPEPAGGHPELAQNAGPPGQVLGGGPGAAVPAASAPGAKPSPVSPHAEILKKFEGMVSEAREEAKREREKAARETSKPGEIPAATPPAASAASGPATAAAPATATGTVASADKAPASAPAASSAATASTPAQDTTPADSRPPGPLAAAEQPREAPSKVGAPSATDTASHASVSIPVPIMFVYNESTFTDEGRRAADLLLEYLKLKHLTSVTLSGHADERGSGPYNMDLSRERLEAVERHLRTGGFMGTLDLLPKGETEPFTGVDRTRYTAEALFQLDRRVELRVVR
jgi:outer membrane protein OmpA-like peptidoglycan-associated protein